MAQARVTEFFSAKKRGAGSHASKRRKIDVTESSIDAVVPKETNIRPTRSSTRSKTLVCPLPENVQISEPQTKSVKKTRSVRKGAKSKTPALDKTQKSIKDVLVNLQNEGKSSDDSASETSETPSLADEKINEEVTSAWDEHDGPPLTPSKRQEISSDSSDDDLKHNKSRKRTRRGKAVHDEVQKTPEKSDIEENIKPRRARKRLQLRANVIASSESETSEVEVSIFKETQVIVCL